MNQTVPSSPTFVRGEAGYPAGLADPSQFNPLTANITYMPRDYHSSPVQPGLKKIATYADGIGANKALIVPVAPDGTLKPPTDLIARAR